MAENTNKFLNYEGVSHLWNQVVANINASVEVEKTRAEAAEKVNADAIGTLTNLETTKKDNLVDAINEVRQAVEVGGTGSVVTMESSTTTEGALKSYTIKQGGALVGIIDIPKDMVVESGSVVTLAENEVTDLTAGTYIKLVLANVTEPLYINVGTLVDLYTAAESATQVQVAVDNTTRKISATIVAGGVGTTELADSSVTTVKIADTNVTLAKLSTELQTSIGKADSAVQKVEIGSTNGTIAVDGTDVAVKGLGSAAYANTDAFDTAGAAATAKSEAITEANTYTDNTIADAIQAISISEIDKIINGEDSGETSSV